MSETVRLELPILSPGVTQADDPSAKRLIEYVLRCRGVTRAHVQNGEAGLELCLHYDPKLVSLSRVQRVAKRAGIDIRERYKTLHCGLSGMDCPDCSASIEHLLGRRDGIINISVSYATETLQLSYDTERVSFSKLKGWLTELGYELVEEPSQQGWFARNRSLAISLISGAFLLAGFVSEVLLSLPTWLWLPLYLAAYLTGGFDATKHAVLAATRFRFDIDFLMVVAAIGAAVLGHWADGALLLFLFSFGHALEHSAMDKARDAMSALGALTPKSATVMRGGSNVELPVGEIQRGDRVYVKNGERLPVDGIVRTGTSDVDQSPVTGESVPLQKSEGDEVFAGTVNGAGILEIEVTKLAQDATIARVLQLVKEAESHKSPTAQITEKFTRIFVPLVIVLVVSVAVLPPLLPAPFYLEWRDAFLRAMAILVGASPCALAIATPSAILAGIAQAARHGVLVKGGVHLENLGRLRAIAFDKTGTLTRGKPSVVTVQPADGVSKETLLGVAASVESMSTHPLANAVVGHARAHGAQWPQAEAVVTVTGQGVHARVDGKKTSVGSMKLFAGEAVPASIVATVSALEARGQTVCLVRQGETYLGAIGVQDPPRDGIRQALGALKAHGVRPLVMLTGDNQSVANAVAKEVGISEVRAGLMPEQKLAAIQELLEAHGQVAMVGDGINDAPAMKNATVGIAMGAGGTDVALETADIALMSDDISRLEFAVLLSRRCRRVVYQNLLASLVVVLTLVITGLFGLTGIGIAIVVHEGSTLAVVGNALRLLRFKTEG